ncbi:33956_t:CDS:1, partial [Racocetra persica]
MDAVYYKPSQEEILATRTDVIPVNTRKAIDKWVQILKNWRQTVGYNYGIEEINSKDQLETEMIEFILGIRQVKNSAEYAPSSLINCINLLSLYLLNHSDGNRQFTLSNKKKFRLLWSTLNGKLKKLKKSRNIVKHHDNLTDEE